MTTPLTPDLAAARRTLSTSYRPTRRGWHGPAAPRRNRKAMLRAAPVVRGHKRIAERTHWAALGTPDVQEGW